MVAKACQLLTVPAVTDVVDGAGHDVHLEEPGRLVAMLDEVIQTPGSVPRC